MTLTPAEHARVCEVPRCDRKHYGHGYCKMHYQRWRKGGDLSVLRLRRVPAPGSSCTLPDCGRPHKANGLCAAHNERRRRGGSLAAPVLTDRPCLLCGGSKNGRRADYCGTECARVGWTIRRWRRSAPGFELIATRDRTVAANRARALLAFGYRRVSQRGAVRSGEFVALKRGALFVVRWMEPREERKAA